MTVLYATVLFFTAMSGRVREIRSQVALLTLALALGLVGVVFLAKARSATSVSDGRIS